MKRGAVLFFTAQTGNSTEWRYDMIVAYVHHNGYPMTEALRKLKWLPLTDLGYAGEFQN